MDGLRATLLLLLGASCAGHTLSGHGPDTDAGQRAGAGDTTCLAAQDEVLWIGTGAAGLFRMTPAGSERYDAGAGLVGEHVHDCVLSGGTVWVATDEALCRLDPARDRFETVTSGHFTHLARSDHGLWASARDGGVIRIDTGG